MALVASAITNRDSAQLADVGLRLADGERVLLRSHQSGVTARAILRKTVKLAADQNDTATLERVAKAAAAMKDDALATEVTAAKKLAGATRAVNPAFAVSVLNADTAIFTRLKGYTDDVRGAELLCDVKKLDELDDRLKADTTLTDAQKRGVRELTAAARGALPKAPSAEDEAVRKLLTASRGTNTFTVVNNSNNTVCVAVTYFEPEWAPSRSSGSSSLAVIEPAKWVSRHWYCVGRGERKVIYSGDQARVWVHFSGDLTPDSYFDSGHIYVHPTAAATLEWSPGRQWPMDFRIDKRPNRFLRNEDEAKQAGLVTRKFYALNANTTFTLR